MQNVQVGFHENNPFVWPSLAGGLGGKGQEGSLSPQDLL